MVIADIFASEHTLTPITPREQTGTTYNNRNQQKTEEKNNKAKRDITHYNSTMTKYISLDSTRHMLECVCVCVDR